MRCDIRCLSTCLVLFTGFVASATAADTTGKDAPEKKAATPKPVIPVFRLTGPVHESPVDQTFSSFGAAQGISLKDLVSRMKKAADDPAVKAVVVLAEGATIGRAQVEEIRQAMTEIREAKKDVYVHSDTLHMSDYVLLSGATRLSVVPTADLWVTGLHGESPYVRGLLDKLGAKPDFLTCGEYKSAAEMFMRESPSPQAEKMQNWLLDGMYATAVRLIAEGRSVKQEKVRDWIDNGPYTAEKAKTAGLVDAVEHRQAFTKMLKDKFGSELTFEHKYGQKKHPTLDLNNPFAMFQIWGEILGNSQKKKSTKPAVGIVYVDGPIMLGGGTSPFEIEEGALSSRVRKALDDAAGDTSIKAVVLRVNSPGGSAVASEIILDATRRVKDKKPFVVSMGNVAGSGGYYVACAADTIFADEATITGSIGVLAGKVATTDMWKHVGITFKSYSRGKHASLLGSEAVFTSEQREKMQGWMDDIYGVFKQHVVDIRGSRLKKPIDELAGGRVYTGRQALELGLVDKLGTLQDAIEHVAKAADLSTEYDVRSVPETRNLLEQLLEEAGGGKDEPNRVEMTESSWRPEARRGESLIELALPHLQHLDPRRVDAIRRVLARLEMLQQEGVILSMPEVTFSP